MAELVCDCPRCGTKKITFVVRASNIVPARKAGTPFIFEAFASCRACGESTIFLLRQQSHLNAATAVTNAMPEIANIKDRLDTVFHVVGYISLKDVAAVSAPEHLPDNVRDVFAEGATCCSVQCWNAAAAMFRLCLDLATKSMLPPPGTPGIKRFERTKLAPRLEWLFAHNLLPKDLVGLSDCIREDGNDGAHDGAIAKNEALDLQDFSQALLARLYTEPKRLEIAEQRRKDRRGA